MFPALCSKRLSWADMSEEEDTVKDICGSSSIDIEQLVRVIHYLLPKCMIDPNKTAHHYRIHDVFYDVMYRSSIVISVSSTKMKQDDDTKIETTDKEQEEKYEQKGKEEPNEIQEIQENQKVQEIQEVKEVKEVKEIPWTRVGSKQPLCYTFSNDSRQPFFDFLETTSELSALSKSYRWFHAYNPEKNKLYEFFTDKHTGKRKCHVSSANEAYQHRFRQWLENKPSTDTRTFKVYRENSTWPTWTLLHEIQGLTNVRRAVMAGTSEYGHAYCSETNDLVNFWLTNGKFRQRVGQAPQKYLDRLIK